MQRTFFTGDHWLYYKIYVGAKTADMILTDIIKPVCEQLLADQLIDKWFFIRYSDPKHHVRWRLHFENTENIGKAISLIHRSCAPFFDTGHIHKIQTDTYKRELERYGSNAMELGETLFWHDSTAVVDALDMIEGDEGEKIRWLFSMRSIDQLLNDFKFSTQQKFDLLNSMADNFGREFNINASLIIQTSDKYRKEKTEIYTTMNRDKDKDNLMLPLFELLDKRSTDSADTVDQILKLQQENKLQMPLNNLMSSYIHMLMNRTFRSKQRIHEMVIYGFLFRYYRTELARLKYAK